MKTKKMNMVTRWIATFVAVAMVVCSNVQAFASESTENQVLVNEEGVTITVVTEDSVDGSMVVPYSDYTSSGSFKLEQKTPNRSFDGNDIHCTITIHNSAGLNNGYAKTFTVKLYRYNWWLDQQYIGSATVSREGTHTISWTNVGPGTYYFVFSKADDGTTQYIDSVRFYN